MASLLAKVSGFTGLRPPLVTPAPDPPACKEEQQGWSDSLETSLEHFSPLPKKGKGKTLECQVPGCTEVPPQKIYYQRHRICLYHSNLPGVVLDGKGLRWCQQCGRFQTVEEFDGERKTCRAVLERHNARRRKRTAERAGARKAAAATEPSPTASSCATKHGVGLEPGWAGPAEAAGARRRGTQEDLAPEDEPQGTSFFGNMSRAQSTPDYPQLMSGGGSTWDPMAQQQMLRAQSITQPQQLPPYLGSTWDPMQQQQQQFLQQSPTGSSLAEPRQRASQPLQCAQPGGTTSNQSGADAATAIGPGDDGELGIEAGQELTSRMLDELMGDSELQDMLGFADLSMQDLPVLEPSLLRSTDLRELLDRPVISMQLPSLPLPGCKEETAQPLPPPLEHALQQPSSTVVLRTATVVASPFCQPLLAAGAPGPQQQAQPEPAAYAASTAPRQQACHAAAPTFESPWAQQSQHAQQAAMRTLPPASAFSGYGNMHPPQLPMGTGVAGPDPAMFASWFAPPAPAMAQPQPQMQAAPAQMPYGQQQEYLVRLSMKLFNVVPEDLPATVRQDVVSLITSDPIFVDSFVRPGCTHLTFVAMLCPADRERLHREGAQGFAKHLLERAGWLGAGPSSGGQAWASDMLVQLDNQVAVVKEGRLAMVVRTDATAPRLVASRPAAVLAPGYEPAAEASGSSASSSSSPRPAPGGQYGVGEGVVALWGYHISGSHDMVVCRQGGQVLNLEIVARGRLPVSALASDPPPEWVLVKPLGVGVGLLQFEVQRGGLLSKAVSVAALPSRAAVAEAQQAHKTLAGFQASQSFLQGLGIVVQHLPTPGGAAVTPHPVIAALATRLLAAAHMRGWQELARLLQMVAGSTAFEPKAAPTAAAPVAAAEGQSAVGACLATVQVPDMLISDVTPQTSLPEVGEPSTPPSPAAGKGCQRGAGSEAGSSSDSDMPGSAEPDLPPSSCAEFAKIGGDYAKWLAQQLRFAPGNGSGSLHACMAILLAATGTTIVLRNMLGEVQ